MTTEQKLAQTALLIGAVANPTRLKILLLLGDHHELFVSALRGHLGIDSSLISHCLIDLRSKGLVNYRKESRNVFYSLTRPTLLNCIQSLIDSQFVE